MMRARKATRWLAGCLLTLTVTSSVFAAKPAPADVLAFKPRQEGVNYSTPTAQEQAACQVELVTGANNSSGWLLRDPKGRPLRRFFDTNGDRRPDVWSYYLDGVEVYREIDSTFAKGKPDQYRWLNAGGMKWGVDANGDGKIDTWRMISAEEASQEILQAIITKDFARLQALFITAEEMTELGLPAAEVTRIQESLRGASAKFQALCTKVTNLNDKTRWLHLETGAPACIPADQSGAKYDIVKYPRSTILCETNGKHDWIQAGEIVQVRSAWRILEAPSAGDGGSQESTPADPALQASLDQLRQHDSQGPKNLDPATQGKEIATYNLVRANLLEQIVQKVKPEERDQWVRQIADCLSAAAQNSPPSDQAAYDRLVRLEKQLVDAVPGSAIAAYVTFREMSAENAIRMAKREDVNKVQDQWLVRLAKFVETYPTAEDTPEALMQLGMVSEFVNKEADAKKWYEMLTKKFAGNALAAKASGALKRLDVEGKPLELAGPMLQGGTFNLAQVRGKTVIVYYWASWNKERSVGDFASLKLLMNTYGPKGVELVCVNLDNAAEEATAFLQKSPSPGIHLFQPGGLDSPLASQYGVMVLPNVFLVDKQGKVVSRTLQVGNLEEELKKLIN